MKISNNRGDAVIVAGVIEMRAKTKIVCTLGSALRYVSMIEKLLNAGMNVACFNFSHGSHEYHQETLDNLKAAMVNTDILCALCSTPRNVFPEVGKAKHLSGCLSRWSR